MPELPEVETIRHGLKKYLVGKRIVGVEVRLKRIVTGDTSNVIDGEVVGVRRVGKGLIIDLDNGYSIAIHIKLTGQLIYKDIKASLKPSARVGGELPNKWTHVIFKLKTKSEKIKTEEAYLYYNDLRQFGWIKILPTNEVGNLPFFRELGPEPPVVAGPAPSFPPASARRAIRRAARVSGSLPLVSPATLTLDVFRNIISKSSTKIKPLLMDQKKIGGVGNIYANDALYLAGIDPRRSVKTLRNEEIKKLYEAILEVLKRGLQYGGASEINFVNALGQEGDYQKHFLAYGQDGKPCQRDPKNHGLIQKVFLGGRGTYFCTKCQK